MSGSDALDALMARLSQGDRDAFEPLYDALSPRALRYALRRLPRADAEDAAQNALLRTFARASEFEPGRPVLPWFYAVLLNEVRAVLRKTGRDDSLEAVLEPASGGADALSLLEEREMHERLAEALDGLDASSREAVEARLGERLGPTTGSPALRKRLSRAYAQLRLLMGMADV